MLMKSASSKDIKSELEQLDHAELSAICLRLARFKMENKELLTYLLFQAQDETGFVLDCKDAIKDAFDGINDSNLYLLKKSIRKIIRHTEKKVRYSGKDSTAAELYLELLLYMNKYETQMKQSVVIRNMYLSLSKKLRKIVDGMHEDLQYDFTKSMRSVVQDF